MLNSNVILTDKKAFGDLFFKYVLMLIKLCTHIENF